MIAQVCPKHMFLYGYNNITDQNENKADATDLYKLATKSRPTRKLLLMGGLHGLDPTGVPSGQEPAEKTALYAGSLDVAVGGSKVTTFALNDIEMKRFTGINFTYKNLGKYTTRGSDMTAEKQAEVIELLKQYHTSNSYYILLCWCFSRTWALANGL
jgi:hypothetical protein